VAVGDNSLAANTTAGNNTAVGHNALTANVAGASNSALGSTAGATYANETACTFVGSATDATANNLNNCTAIGSGATVSASNTIALGRSAGQDTVLVPGPLTVIGAISNADVAYTAPTTFSPTLTGFTIVNGTGAISSTGKYSVQGHIVTVTVTLTGTGTATIAAVGGTSYITNLPFTISATMSGPGSWCSVGGTFQCGQVIAYGPGAAVFPSAWSALTLSSAGPLVITVTYVR